jgi:hypothetical protein
MPRQPKKVSNANQPATKVRSYYTIQPWECRHDNNRSEILAYVEASGKWETILTVHPTSGASTEALGSHICNLINQHQIKENILQEAMSALELVMNDGLTFSSEQAVERAFNNLKRSG